MTDNDLPRVGTPSDEHRTVCLYSFRPGDPQCGKPATLHVMVDSDVPTADDGRVSLPTCDEHAPIARAAGRFVAEHPHAGVCGLPGSVWLPDANVCVIDDSGVEPTRSGTYEAVAR